MVLWEETPLIERRPVIAVVGPTATGKTALAAEIARWLDTEVISADSQIIYRELDIGTAKPSEMEKQGIPHHMIDVAAPDEVFSVASYQTQASQQLDRLWKAGRVPVVAGGTGFYIRALLQEDFLPAVPPDSEFRHRMAVYAQTHGPDALHVLLKAKDPVRADALHPHDQVRVIRALEVIEATGQPVPQKQDAKGFDILWLGLTYENRDLLRSLIDQRIENMMAAGWLEEVNSLVQRYGPDTHALQVAHGYPELTQVVLGQRDPSDALEQIRINIHQYARRQMTWFRRTKEIRWFVRDGEKPEDLPNFARTCIKEKGLPLA